MKTAVTLCAALIVGSFAACDHIPFLSDSDSYEPPLVTIPLSGPAAQLVFRPSDGDPVLVVKSGLWEEAPDEYAARPSNEPIWIREPIHVADAFSVWQVPAATMLNGMTIPYEDWITASYLTIGGDFIASSAGVTDSTRATRLRVQSTETGATVSEMEIPRADGYLMGVGADAGDHILVMSGFYSNGTLRLHRYNMTSLTHMDSTDLLGASYVHIHKPDNGYVSPNGRYVPLWQGNVYDMDGDGSVPIVLAYTDNIVGYGPDGSTTAVAATDSALALESLPSRTEIARFDITGVVKVAFALESPRLATWDQEGMEGTIAVWDTETGEQITEFRVPDVLRAFAISPDGRYIAAGYSLGAYGEVPTGEVRIWEVSTEEL